jgi:2-oxoglutarate ferredoxin oxidoreductase subunit gamma
VEASVILAGFGGQGLLFAGHVLAEAAMREGREVSWMPSYGPEMRGGTASCTVILADRPIGSPMVDAADVLIALNPPSLARFESVVAAGGLLVFNTSLIETTPSRDDIEVVGVPATALAREAGDDRLACVVALGALLGRRRLVDQPSIDAALAELVGRKRPELVDANIAALAAGRRASAEPVLAAAGPRRAG